LRGGTERHYRFGGGCNRNIIWQLGRFPRQCPLVLLVKDLFNFEFKDVGAAVVGEMESNFGRAILWRKILKR
jgi:hypothetical protein